MDSLLLQSDQVCFSKRVALIFFAKKSLELRNTDLERENARLRSELLKWAQYNQEEINVDARGDRTGCGPFSSERNASVLS